MKRSLNVAVIGAGPSGIVATKELIAAAHQVTCFEMADNIGGVFNFREEEGGVYESCMLTSSITATTYSDFNSKKGAPYYFTHQEYHQYLSDYCDNFALRESIKLSTKVEHIVQLEDGKWQVTTKLLPEGDSKTQIFDAVAICTGVHKKAMIPEFKGKEQFKGQIVHSSSYKNAQPYKDKKVVVIGVGESGADVVKEISDVAQSCQLSLRRGAYVFPRLVDGYPNDYLTSRLYYSMPSWIDRVVNPREYVKKQRKLGDKLFFPVRILMLPLAVVNTLYSELTTGFKGLRSLFAKKEKTAEEIKQEKIQDVINELSIKSGGGVAEQFSTKSDRFIHSIVDGDCELKPGIESLYENGVVYKDGTQFEADTIMCCTGYQNDFSFLDMDIGESKDLYMNCFHPKVGQSLCFIGAVRPGAGSIPPIAEMQSRWFAKICTGELSLPSNDEIARQIEMDAQSHEKVFSNVTVRLPYLVDYTSYMDKLSEKVGCKPKLRDLIGNPVALYKFYCGNFSSSQYRLSGTDSKKDIALKEIREIEVSRTFYTNAVMFSYYWFCKFYSFIGIKSFKPHLSLSIRDNSDRK
ncbi:hypothetical protein CWB99_21580 [Pseudoalteromonas rubra]|uniref:Monooxygenase n=1 Tax=Pseudoalteromonas rubra TaxID=43658 RepID=A0A5S3WH03_9GAMM|nr:NAD(P)-binding domain-containing protein [Pseudoalteromonas rubra]TMP24607.1 hypothetical protein CWB99_21580 [Pseudoalteromonas rubra]TMP36320.1 hypothetical protein CWC00_02445 [Pseudoalteromonas rubra]